MVGGQRVVVEHVLGPGDVLGGERHVGRQLFYPDL